MPPGPRRCPPSRRTEAARLSGLAIADQTNGHDFAKRSKQLCKLRLVSVERQVSYMKFSMYTLQQKLEAAA